MQTSVARIVAAAVGALAMAATTLAQESEGWQHDFEQAEADAKSRDLPLLVHFHAKWCGPCRQMDQSVLHDAVLLKQLRTGFVAVKIDFDERRDLAQRFEIQTLPSDLFLDPKGRVLERSVGGRDRQTYLAMVARIDARASQARAAQIALQSKPLVTDPGAPPKHRDSPVAPSPVASRGAAPGPLPAAILARTLPRVNAAPAPTRRRWLTVGLRGFSPVALVTNRRWIHGDEKLIWEYKGIVYRMASAEELRHFKESPDRYAPQVLGCDPVVLEIADRAVQGDIRYAAFYDAELYLFVSDKSREAFKLDPDRFVRTKHVLKVDELDDKRLE